MWIYLFRAEANLGRLQHEVLSIVKWQYRVFIDVVLSPSIYTGLITILSFSCSIHISIRRKPQRIHLLSFFHIRMKRFYCSFGILKWIHRFSPQEIKLTLMKHKVKIHFTYKCKLLARSSTSHIHLKLLSKLRIPSHY